MGDALSNSNTDHSILGRFWLSGQDESSSIPGVMEFGSEGAAVRLEGALTERGLLADATVYARLQGSHDTATLFNCFASATFGASKKVVYSKLDSTLIALGSLREDLGGHAVRFRLPGSETWFHEPCFNVDFGKTSEDVVVHFKAFESTEYRLSDGLAIERLYVATVPMGNWGMERFEVSRPLAYRICSTSRLGFDRLWEEMYRLRRLLEFFSQQRFPHTGMALYDARGVAEGTPDIDIRHSSTRTIKVGKFEWDQQLVLFDDIKDRFPALLRRWFEVHRGNPEPFERYFAAFDRGSEDIILHFLWNVAALEELHKIRTARKDFYLLDRLKDIRARWSAAFDTQPPDTVLEQIKDSRHYYAHAAGDLREKAAKDWVLLRYGHFLAALSNLEILALLGFPDDEVVKIARKYWMRESLALKMFPGGGGS